MQWDSPYLLCFPFSTRPGLSVDCPRGKLKMVHEVVVDFAGRPLKIESGRMAQQSDASVVVTYGDTVVLATANVTDKPTDMPFMPLRVDFEEKMYSVGRIPGGFFKREGRPSEDAILTCRKTDRPIRPLLEPGMRNDMQVIILPLSVDIDSSVDVIAMIAGSAAMHLSSIPFAGPFGVVRVAQFEGEMVVSPTFEMQKEATLDLLVAATREGIVQLEMDGQMVDDEDIKRGLEVAYDACMPIVAAIEELREKAGKPKGEFELWEPRPEATEFVTSELNDRIIETLAITDRLERDTALGRLQEEAATVLEERGCEKAGQDVEAVFETIVKARLQDLAFDEEARVDGRKLDEIRPISVEAGFLPRVHGSGLFQRGETQVLTTTTFGAYKDQKLVRTLEEEEYSRFTHHYNFPPFSTGEVKGLRGASRRDVGHGAIGEKAIERVLPPEEEFPYTIRLVSEVLAANASTSMAATCACSIALMDAGVPITGAVAGAGIGLIRRGDDYRLLTDMQGVEDFMGYMDFKIAGTAEGVTCMQMDTKTHGLPLEILFEALEKGKQGRLHILAEMNAVIAEPRAELSAYAPCMLGLSIKEDKIGLVIGPGGKNIRGLQTDYDVQIDVDDEGGVRVFGVDRDNVEKVAGIIADMTREIEAGEIFTGKVVTITDFGAFIELIPGRDGLLHISDIAWEHVDKTEDVLSMGEEVKVKVVSVDDDGKIRLSRKELLERGEGSSDSSRGSSSSSRSSSSRRGDRGGGSSNRSKRGGSSKNSSGGSGRDSGSREPRADRSDTTGPSRGKAYFRDKPNDE